MLDLIAVGGMGEVWRAHDDLLDRTVAVKIVAHRLSGDPQVLSRFRLEARHAAALSHPGIAGVFDYGESDDRAYLVMELVPGEPLSALLAREGALPPGRALDIVGQAALALQAAHDLEVVHRDVKPANLIVRPDGVVKVTDFGIARALDDASLTATGMFIGTAQYVSPEQVSGGQVTPASDVYCLGLVAYEALAGSRPFATESPIATALARVNAPAPPLPAALPEPIRDLVGRALAKDPNARPASAAELGRQALALSVRYANLPALDRPTPDRPAADLPAAGAAQPTRGMTTPLSSPPTRRGPEPSQRKVRWSLIAAGAFVVVVGFFGLRACAAAAVVSVPKLTGLAGSTAVADLRHLGLAAKVVRASSRTVPAGRVISQSPRGGSSEDTGSAVTLTVSTGLPRVQVVASRYIGEQLRTVESQLTALGLKVTPVAYATSSRVAGTVLEVAPTGSQAVGATVRVTVATAVPPQPATMTPPQPPGTPGGNGPGDKGHDHGH